MLSNNNGNNPHRRNDDSYVSIVVRNSNVRIFFSAGSNHRHHFRPLPIFNILLFDFRGRS
jgi:hypothetical protein